MAVESEIRRIYVALHRVDELEGTLWEPARQLIRGVLLEYLEELDASSTYDPD